MITRRHALAWNNHFDTFMILLKIFIYTNINVIIGDVAETIADFFEGSEITKSSKSRLTLYDIDTFLSKLSTLTKEDEQAAMLGSIAKKCTTNDLKMIIRLIKGDLRINAGTVCFYLYRELFSFEPI